DVVERRDVGRALNRCVAAQRHDAAAGTSDVAEQQLQNRRSANRLDAGRMLRPADRVTDRGRFLATGSAREDVGDFDEALARNAARLLDELRRVAREVALQYLKHAARMLQRFIAMRLIEILRFAAAIFSVT